ncbi:hypothetical protein DY000_02035358 [Brassica cretica]|uniref:Ubiquitinyl hydrolase 1 n=1 Tax=Brassica cretica TaxID=69181 RepID=A0ABQ7DTC2_BRACR|nr:hypothetical protein DY000_02035358 [Brassica cretica]
MAIPNSTAFNSVIRFRSPEEEKRIVSELTTNLNEGDSYFVISKRWYTSWQKYIAPIGGGAPRPGPIDNSDIIDDTTSDGDPQLRRYLVEDEDYVLVPHQVWKTLLEWYNVGPPIPMTLIYLLLSDERNVHNVTDIRLAKEASIRELYVKVCAKTGVSLEKARIWGYLNRRKVKLLNPLSNESLEESGLLMDQDILLEVDEVGLAGLVNLGNTCYMMNSTLRCLAHTPPILQYFLRDYTHQGELTKAFGELLKELWSSRKKAVAPSFFKTKLDKAAPQFSGHYQYDSHELLISLLARLHEVSDVCQGQCKSTLVCPVCGKIANTYDSFTSLSLPLPSTRTWSISFLSCLENFLAEEPLGPNNMWFCPECKEKRKANKKLDLWKLPEILVLHLKRFRTSKYFVKKIDTFVNFPINDLDLSKYVKNKNGESYLYELYAVSNHYIGPGGVRHYTAYAKLIDYNKWYHFNDSYVSPVNESVVRSKAAYLLFYRRVGSETEEAQSSEVSMTDDMD